jgi:hypothetical protein
VPWPEHLQTVVIPWTSMKRPSLSLDWLLFDDVTISLLGITTDALTHAESQGWIGGRKHSQLGFGAHALSLCPCLPICVCHNLSLSLSLSPDLPEVQLHVVRYMFIPGQRGSSVFMSTHFCD